MVGVRAKQVQVKLAIPFIGEVAGTWEPDDAERLAAWELYVELVTRVGVIALGPAEGLLREALSSLHQLFGVTRDILRRHGPAVAPKASSEQVSFGALAVAILNGALRPMLAEWHSELLAHEATRPAEVSAVQHERAWARAAELRAELEQTRALLVQFAYTLGEVAGAASLLPQDAPTGVEPSARRQRPPQADQRT
jgi:hypothetical protein